MTLIYDMPALHAGPEALFYISNSYTNKRKPHQPESWPDYVREGIHACCNWR